MGSNGNGEQTAYPWGSAHFIPHLKGANLEDIVKPRRDRRWDDRYEWVQGKRPFVRQMFRIPNNPWGWLVLALLKRYANRRSYRVWARGRRWRWYVRPWNRVTRWIALWLRDEAGDFVGPMHDRFNRWADRVFQMGIYTGRDVSIRHARALGIYLVQREVTRMRRVARDITVPQ